MSRCNATTLRKASRCLSAMYDSALVGSGLRATQFAILAELNRKRDRPLLIRELARTMGMDRSTLGHNLRPLDRAGLVVLAIDDDRRGRRVVLTAAGFIKYMEALPLWEQAQVRFETLFGLKRAEKLRQLAAAVLEVELLH
jgi:DNA-binding MarR family transcriptional regulator